MIITTTDFITGKEIETLGIVKGSTVQTKNIGRDIAAGLKNLVGGELTGYTEMMNEARAIATDRMILEAQVLEADAVVGVSYATSSITQGAAEVIVYGTAVKFLNKE
ncbi:MAG: YbjQ family protein [Clostridia bacterium]|nr:YbjQ family protein [Clostridia bacterium]